MILNRNLYMTGILLLVLLMIPLYFYSTSNVMPDNKRIYLRSRSANVSEVSIEDLLLIGKRNRYSNGVPMIVHYNYKSKRVPSQYVPLVKKCIDINPNATFVFWSDLSSFHFIKNHFKEYFHVYLTYLEKGVVQLKKSDIIRYFILEHIGGIYMDLDTRCQRPLEEGMKEESCILSREVELQTQIFSNVSFFAMNSFMACIRNHKFFRYLINNIVKENGEEVINLTGPRFLTNAFNKYNQTLGDKDTHNRIARVIVAPSDTYSPLYDIFPHDRCNHPNGKCAIIGCRGLPEYLRVMDKKVSEAIVVHLFYHIGNPKFQHKIKQFLDLSGFPFLYFVVEY